MVRTLLLAVLFTAQLSLRNASAQDLETFAVQVSQQDLGDFLSQGGYSTSIPIPDRTEWMAGRLCTTFNTRAPRASRIAYFSPIGPEIPCTQELAAAFRRSALELQSLGADDNYWRLGDWIQKAWSENESKFRNACSAVSYDKSSKLGVTIIEACVDKAKVYLSSMTTAKGLYVIESERDSMKVEIERLKKEVAVLRAAKPPPQVSPPGPGQQAQPAGNCVRMGTYTGIQLELINSCSRPVTVDVVRYCDTLNAQGVRRANATVPANSNSTLNLPSIFGSFCGSIADSRREDIDRQRFE